MGPIARRILKRLLPRPLLLLGGALILDRGAVQRSERLRWFHHAFTALRFNGIDGDYVEFGCHSGTTFSLAYHESRRLGYETRLWAFDSFCGLPASDDLRDNHPFWTTGKMATSVEEFHKLCRKNGIPAEAYTVVEGYYRDTLDRMSQDQPPTNICLAYVDCDLYSSTNSVLRFLLPRLKHGMIICFDDYYCFSSTQVAGERKAMLECCETNPGWGFLPYRQCGTFGASFIVEARS